VTTRPAKLTLDQAKAVDAILDALAPFLPKQKDEILTTVMGFLLDDFSPEEMREFLRRSNDDIRVRWLRLSEQNFRVDKWNLCRG
jgi:predicted ATP-dependent Lon-type protease